MIIDQILLMDMLLSASVTGTGRSPLLDLMVQQNNWVMMQQYLLGSQDWSNGNVAMIEKSYDGSTPWQAAMFGNEHLKTIVPISGLIGVKELMWKWFCRSKGSDNAMAFTVRMVLMVTKKTTAIFVLTIS